MSRTDVVVIGGGLAGLCCAGDLAKAGFDVRLLEASDAVGGRVRTDEHEGFLLDRGFQVLLTAYPECRARLDYKALGLHAFQPGAMVRFDGRFHVLSDPWRRPLDAIAGALSSVGTLGDKARVAAMRAALRLKGPEELFAAPATSTLERLRAGGLSEGMIDRFFRAWFGGVFFDRSLGTSSRVFDFLFKMFAEGDASVPARGMRAIPEQLAAGLPHGVLRLNTPVSEAHPGWVRLSDGEQLSARAVVIATDGPEAARLLGAPASPGVGTTCLYFDAPEPPVRRAMLVLDGDGTGPVNNVAVMSQVCPGYAPPGRSLVACAVLGVHHDTTALARAALEQLRGWFGDGVRGWRLLRSYVIAHALPDQSVIALEPSQRPVRHSAGLFVCGDHRDHGSIQGAMASGARCGSAVAAALRA